MQNAISLSRRSCWALFYALEAAGVWLALDLAQTKQPDDGAAPSPSLAQRLALAKAMGALPKILLPLQFNAIKRIVFASMFSSKRGTVVPVQVRAQLCEARVLPPPRRTPTLHLPSD